MGLRSQDERPRREVMKQADGGGCGATIMAPGAGLSRKAGCFLAESRPWLSFLLPEARSPSELLLASSTMRFLEWAPQFSRQKTKQLKGRKILKSVVATTESEHGQENTKDTKTNVNGRPNGVLEERLPQRCRGNS